MQKFWQFFRPVSAERSRRAMAEHQASVFAKATEEQVKRAEEYRTLLVEWQSIGTRLANMNLVNKTGVEHTLTLLRRRTQLLLERK